LIFKVEDIDGSLPHARDILITKIKRDLYVLFVLTCQRNLSYKGIAALRWISTHCSRASYVLKTDDDMFVNMFALIKHLKDLHSAGYRRRLLMCYVWWKMHVLREGQWGIPKEVMPEDLYPVYCSGMGYVYSLDVVAAMYRVSYYVR